MGDYHGDEDEIYWEEQARKEAYDEAHADDATYD